MKKVVNQAIKHWSHVAPLLSAPRSATQYKQLVEALDAVLDAGGADEKHPLAALAERMGDLIHAYEEKRLKLRDVSGANALKFLMQQHGLKQADLAEIGPQSVVSDILKGKRKLNVRQIAALAHRFGVAADVFIDYRQRLKGAA